MITNIEYSVPDYKTYGIESGERVELVYDNDRGFILAPAVVWERAEKALLQEQYAAKVAAEKELRLHRIVDGLFDQYLPMHVVTEIRNWVGTRVLRNLLLEKLRHNGYLE